MQCLPRRHLGVSRNEDPCSGRNIRDTQNETDDSAHHEIRTSAIPVLNLSIEVSGDIAEVNVVCTVYILRSCGEVCGHVHDVAVNMTSALTFTRMLLW